MKRLAILLSAATFAQSGMDLFLLIGQSNMAGRGLIEEQDRVAHPRVNMFSKEDKWVPAVEPVHFDRPDRLGVGLGRSFAVTLAASAPNATIGLIPCAMGGSALDEWKPGGKLYDEAVRRTKLAMVSGRLRGILWHQGEADSNNLDRARSYAARWHEVMTTLRKDLNAADVPIVVGELGRFLYTREKNDYPYARMVGEQQAAFSVAEHKVGFASSEGLGHKGDVLHFDSPALREFGRRYAHAFLALDPAWGK